MMHTEIGQTAGEIWKCLGANGNISLAKLPNKVKKDPILVYQATGWLAREEKIKLSKEGQTAYVSLTDKEMNNYRQHPDVTSECRKM